MSRPALQILRVLAILTAILDGLLLGALALWLFAGRGIIACGKGLMDAPDWFLSVVGILCIPLAVFGSAIWLINYCSRKLAFR
jgi:hypothetical protein